MAEQIGHYKCINTRYQQMQILTARENSFRFVDMKMLAKTFETWYVHFVHKLILNVLYMN